jgi:hypothetical protein
MPLSGFGLCQPADGKHSDIVFLAEVFRCFRNVKGGLIA